MFAGIVEHLGIVRSARPSIATDAAATAATRLEIDLGPLADGLTCGASVAVNGVCLTVAALNGTVAGFDVIPETLRVTNLGEAAPGVGVNLERSLRAGAAIDGHFVQGHVDGVAIVTRIDHADGGYEVWLEAPDELRPYIVRKGSIALDGVSLTIARVQGSEFSVALIPTTLDRTNLGMRQPGARVNVESDILARIIVSRLGELDLAALLRSARPGEAS